jgi:DGQHR domain-containing protein
VLSDKRVKEIALYTEDPDATFPTPIIVAVDSDADYKLEGATFEFDETKLIGEIIDGQHRIAGLKRSPRIDEFVLPVIFMFDLVNEEKAYVFSIINSKQTPVSKSLIFDLFFLAETRSPQKTCHEVASLMNSDTKSPFYKRLKMLGRKEHEKASLSQGSFIKYLMPLISKHPDNDLIDIKRKHKIQEDPTLPLRYYFINKEDDAIYKILFNVFTAVRTTFPEQWNQPNDYILSKTIGYGAIMGALLADARYEQSVFQPGMRMLYRPVA